MYAKQVKNPIRQLKRQVHLLAHYLQRYRIKVWVEGYVILLHQNSPVDSGYIISSFSDIDRAIHTGGKNHLSPKAVEQIITLLQRDGSQLSYIAMPITESCQMCLTNYDCDLMIFKGNINMEAAVFAPNDCYSKLCVGGRAVGNYLRAAPAVFPPA